MYLCVIVLGSCMGILLLKMGPHTAAVFVPLNSPLVEARKDGLSNRITRLYDQDVCSKWGTC